MGSEVKHLNYTVRTQGYAQMFLIESIYIDFKVVAAAATIVESFSEPTLSNP